MYALKVAASLSVGVAAGLWVCSPKTCHSWAGCVARLCTRLSSSGAARPHRRGAGRPQVRPVVPPRSELSLSPGAGGVVTGGKGASSSLYSALDIHQQQQQQQQQQQRCSTIGRGTTGAPSLTTIL